MQEKILNQKQNGFLALILTIFFMLVAIGLIIVGGLLLDDGIILAAAS